MRLLILLILMGNFRWIISIDDGKVYNGTLVKEESESVEVEKKSSESEEEIDDVTKVLSKTDAPEIKMSRESNSSEASIEFKNVYKEEEPREAVEEASAGSTSK